MSDLVSTQCPNFFPSDLIFNLLSFNLFFPFLLPLFSALLLRYFLHYRYLHPLPFIPSNLYLSRPTFSAPLAHALYVSPCLCPFRSTLHPAHFPSAFILRLPALSVSSVHITSSPSRGQAPRVAATP